MTKGDTYRTIENASQGIYKEKGSRFIAEAFPVRNVEEVKALVDSRKKEHFNARHHCYAYMIGHERLVWRANDDREPSGTAGKPILGQINSSELTNILIIVTRYFGGTLLGVSGLINSYRSAAAEAIKNASIVERTVNVYYEICFPYQAMNDVMKIIKEEGIGIMEQTFVNECCIKIYFRLSNKERVMGRFSRIDSIKSKFLSTV